MKKRTMGLLFGMMTAVTLAGCREDAKEANGDGVENVEETLEEEEVIDVKKVAVFFSGAESEETAMKQELFWNGLEEKGYEVSVSLAKDDAEVQKVQIEEQLAQGPDVLIIEPADAYGLSEVLAQAEAMEIPVIAFDELIMDTSAVSYYTTYSYRTMGQMTGEAIKEAKKLEDAVKDQISYNIEFLMGSQDSLEALFYYNGVMEILQPYFDAGVLVCPSGKNTFDLNGILRWDGKQAKIRCEEILENYYQDGTVVDIVCTGFDAAAVSAAEVLEEAGYVCGGENWPLITGLGCEENAVEAIIQGELYSSIYMDEAILIETCIKMADACAKAEEVEINDSVQYDNGVKIVEANVCEAKLYTADNINKMDAGGDASEEANVSDGTDEANASDEMGESNTTNGTDEANTSDEMGESNTTNGTDETNASDEISEEGVMNEPGEVNEISETNQGSEDVLDAMSVDDL